MTDRRFRGYIASRAVNGMRIPQRIQNMVVRNYAHARGMTFLLSATEYGMDRCLMMLQSVLEEELDRLDGIIFFSLYMLPAGAADRRRIYERVLGRGRELHFALEELAIRDWGDVPQIEDILLVVEALGRTPPVPG
jgi:sporadic carbohydrate cluster protein (TIGR04323 family)